MNDVARNRAKLALVVILMLILFSTLSVAKVDANVESSDLHNTIYNGLMSSSSSIDVKRFNLSPDDAYDAFFKVLNDNPELFYVQYGCRVSIVGNKVVTIIPTYHMTGTALVEAKKEFNTFVNDIIKGIPSTFSDIEKVIYVHDYIVANYSYDNSYSIYDAYNFFKQKKGVCQAYSFAFMAILSKLNIPVSVAESSMMNHMWNVECGKD
ncbi:MAG: hypothetical protein GX166_03935 [Clostridiaceae bacterium]|jgi:hypothetical protein|nr:hypothetical protein [Clostridiaceae bacterium]